MCGSWTTHLNTKDISPRLSALKVYTICDIMIGALWNVWHLNKRDLSCSRYDLDASELDIVHVTKRIDVVWCNGVMVWAMCMIGLGNKLVSVGKVQYHTISSLAHFGSEIELLVSTCHIFGCAWLEQIGSRIVCRRGYVHSCLVGAGSLGGWSEPH